MKYAAVAVLLVLSSMSNVVDTCCAQSLDILTGLHPRPKVSYFRGVGSIAISPSTPILISDTASAVALEYLESILQKKLGYTLTPFRGTFKAGIPNAIYLGEHGSYPALDSALNTSLASGEYTPGAQGYVLDISSSGIVLAGTDANGTFNSISTFAQLLKGDSLPLVHINDWPDYPIRWVFSTHNLIVPDQITALKTIEDSMAAHKLNGLQQNDFKNNVYSIFENSYPQYFYNVDSLQTHSYNANVELIPGLFPIGWSEGILFHDPDIAEGIPTTSNYYIEGDTGRLIGDPRVSVPHGDFENASNGTFPGWNWYDPTIFVDSSTVHNGRYSARATNFSDTTPNGRFIKLLTCTPHSGYHMSAWYKTQGFSGEFNLLAIGFHGSDSRALTYTQFGVPATSNGWQQVNVIFNTLGYDSMYVYCGVWSGSAGTIWFDDFHIEDAGMTNLLRPASELPTVTESNTLTSYKEGRDYAMLVDSVMEKNQGT
ncbi:MAG TPA: glycoside hydrolase family 20 zincin-like fold domain-containing protein, partial [Candidatus Kapabacteria bacterium]|nr:glycoside hydrolase family 20 zincin-like fold domain-containing protein [Candidatus Kapabacteria bacterium]